VDLTVEHNVATALLRPRYEGSNIRTWVGFKHLMFLVEEAVLESFRQHDLGPQRLFHEYGLGLEIVDCSVLLPTLVEIDDQLLADVRASEPGRFSVVLRVQRQGKLVTTVRAKARVALVCEAGCHHRSVPPPDLAPLIVPGIAAPDGERHDVAVANGDVAQSSLCAVNPRAFYWSWPARYFYCHFSERVQQSAYIRALEEVVDRYLVDRGLSIRRLLDERGWIPVVPRVRIRMLAPAYMEEVVHTTFTVEDLVKTVAYDSRMDCYVQRNTTLEHVATAQILQGYAVSRGSTAGSLVTLDESTLSLLTGRTRP